MDEMLKRNRAKAIVIQIFQLETQEDISIPRAGLWTLSHWPEDRVMSSPLSSKQGLLGSQYGRLL